MFCGPCINTTLGQPSSAIVNMLMYILHIDKRQWKCLKILKHNNCIFDSLSPRHDFFFFGYLINCVYCICLKLTKGIHVYLKRNFYCMISPCINNFQLNAKNCTRNTCACYYWYCLWIYLFDLNLNACNVYLSSYKYNVYKPFGILVCVTWAFLDGQAISVVSPGEISTGLDCKQNWLIVTLW